MSQTKLHFARFEFKYLLPESLRNELERELQYFVEFDPYVAELPEHQYVVRSLYFDDPSYTCYYDKIDGLHTRRKFRLRTYTRGRGEAVPRFLEIKGRYNNLVLKHRTRIVRGEEIGEQPEDPLMSAIISGTGSSEIGQKFQFDYFRKQIRPVALVDYLRRPYFSRFDPEFRLTFDSHLEATRTRRLFPLDTERRCPLIPGYTVMEVKFRRTIPAWFHRLIQAYELRRRSVSKICLAMEALDLVRNPE